jgi:hypothetical protein
MNVYQKGFFYPEVALAALVVLVAALFFVSEKRCEETSQKMQLRSQWGVITGCMVEAPNGSWVNIKNYYITKSGD